MFSLINDHRNRLNFLLSMTVKLAGIIGILSILNLPIAFQNGEFEILTIFLDHPTEKHKNEILKKQK